MSDKPDGWVEPDEVHPLEAMFGPLEITMEATGVKGAAREVGIEAEIEAS